MQGRVSYIVHKLRESFWFLPSLMTLAAIGLSALTLVLDRGALSRWIPALPWMEGLGLANARLIMSTVAGSMITVTSLVFSLTLVSLTLASGQLGPRLLMQFMRDRMTQTVLGVFVSTFIFALLVLASLGEHQGGRLVPSISITTALALTLLSFGLLIAFIHHLATSLQADVVVARVAADLDAQVSQMFEDRPSRAEPSESAEPPWEDATAVLARTGGYVQAIDRGALVAAARAHQAQIQLALRAGQFVCRGQAVARLRHAAEVPDELESAVTRGVVIGSKRTQAEDPEFGFQAIVEIGLRALSPGINDPFTAITCIDRLGEALVRIFTGSFPHHVHRDEDGAARVHEVPITLDGLVDTAFNQLRQSAAGNVAVLIRLVESLGRMARAASTHEHRDVIRRHIDMLMRSCELSIQEERDREDVLERLGELEHALSGKAG